MRIVTCRGRGRGRGLVLGVIGLVAALFLALPAGGRGAMAFMPAIPLTSEHQYFDHQWYVWLPRHPVYEAVEVLSVDAPSNPYRLVWVIFTERDGEKRQHHFMDDRRIAESTDDFHYREIDYRRVGEAGEGQSVHVLFADLAGARVEVEIDAEGVPLTRTGAGLTDQSGHAAELLTMLFHRERGALTGRNRVEIGGRDFSFRPGDDPERRHPFAAAYSAGIQIVVFPFGRWSFAASDAGLSDESGRLSFHIDKRAEGMALIADLPGHGSRITVALDAEGALERYRHDTGSHRLVIALDEPLPLTGTAPPSASRFFVLMDPDEPVASGRVVSQPVEIGRRLSWTIDTPSWAAGYPFDSLIEEADGGMKLTVRSARPSD